MAMKGRVFPCLLVYLTDELEGPVVVSAAPMSGSLPPPCAARGGADAVIRGHLSQRFLPWLFLGTQAFKICSELRQVSF